MWKGEFSKIFSSSKEKMQYFYWIRKIYIFFIVTVHNTKGSYIFEKSFRYKKWSHYSDKNSLSALFNKINLLHTFITSPFSIASSRSILLIVPLYLQNYFWELNQKSDNLFLKEHSKNLPNLELLRILNISFITLKSDYFGSSTNELFWKQKYLLLFARNLPD